MISLTEGSTNGTSSRKAAEKIYQLRLNAVDITPRIWRRLLVRETMWLSRLHDAIQVSFDWYDYQMHVFTLDELRYGNPFRREGGEIIEDDRDIKLADLEMASRQTMIYDYAFGEGWQVELRFEKLLSLEKGTTYPRCIAGERAGPPEDCGGPEAFKELLHSLKHPNTHFAK